jgi:hypothetical protein
LRATGSTGQVVFKFADNRQRQLNLRLTVCFALQGRTYQVQSVAWGSTLTLATANSVPARDEDSYNTLFSTLPTPESVDDRESRFPISAATSARSPAAGPLEGRRRHSFSSYEHASWRFGPDLVWLPRTAATLRRHFMCLLVVRALDSAVRPVSDSPDQVVPLNTSDTSKICQSCKVLF